MQGIYRIDYSGRCAYVGSALNIERRFRQHKDTLKRGVHRNFILQRMWNKHSDDFIFTIVEIVDNLSTLADREQYFMDTLKPLSNIAKANGSHPHTEETKEKMRGRLVSIETRKKLSDALRGRISITRGIPTGRVPSTAFKVGFTPWNKKYTPDELKEKKKEWGRKAGKKYREAHYETLREYKRIKAREYRERKRTLAYASE